MENNYIRFKQQRELGDIVSATFDFIRKNYKPLARYIWNIVGPLFILLVIGLTYYSYSVPASFIEAVNFETGNFVIAFFILVACMILFYASLYATVYHYIKSYIKHKGEVVDQEILTGVKKDFGKLVLYFSIAGILLTAGLFFFVLPGIYLMVPLSLGAAILVFEKLSVTETISYCFTLIRDHWWMTFLTLVLVGLLVYIIGLIFQIPLIIYTFIQVFTMVQEGSSAEVTSGSDWIMISLQVISSLIRYLLSVISVIAIAFIYFNLNEHKNLTGTYERIENLGN